MERRQVTTKDAESVINDDIISANAEMTPEKRQRIREWFEKNHHVPFPRRMTAAEEEEYLRATGQHKHSPICLCGKCPE